jgi:transcription termination factor Rho
MTAQHPHEAAVAPDLVVLDNRPFDNRHRIPFTDLTPTHPCRRLVLAAGPHDIETRVMDLVTPIGKGQRGLIVAPPRTGKTILLQHIADGLPLNHPECQLFVLLLDERPEEVTHMRARVRGSVEVIASTFDRDPEEHRRVAEETLTRAKRLVEAGADVGILLDSLTRLARACNALAPAGGKLLTGGVVAGALDWPRRFFGAARNAEESGSLTILATALIDTGSRMDEVIFEEFKGTGNMELHLDRRMADRRIWPAIDLHRSGTRREELLLTEDELRRVRALRKALSDRGPAEAMQQLTGRLLRTASNAEALIGLTPIYDFPYCRTKGGLGGP